MLVLFASAPVRAAGDCDRPLAALGVCEGGLAFARDLSQFHRDEVEPSEGALKNKLQGDFAARVARLFAGLNDRPDVTLEELTAAVLAHGRPERAAPGAVVPGAPSLPSLPAEK